MRNDYHEIVPEFFKKILLELDELPWLATRRYLELIRLIRHKIKINGIDNEIYNNCFKKKLSTLNTGKLLISKNPGKYKKINKNVGKIA